MTDRERTTPPAFGTGLSEPASDARLAELVGRFPNTRSALDYAARAHAGQLRQADGAAFIRHPIEVVCILSAAGAPDDVIAAGALHDTIEKTDTDENDLRERFGSHVAAVVLAVTEDNRINGYEARKAALRDQVAHAGQDALMVFAADKISKARELQLASGRPTPTRRQHAHAQLRRGRKLAHYDRCLELLDQLLRESPLVTQLRTELDTLKGRPLI